ncbi:MAG: hypothetical protein WBM69_21005 [Desulfobacterales bacterium]
MYRQKINPIIDCVSFHARFQVITHIEIKKNSYLSDKGEHEKNEYGQIHTEGGVNFLSFHRKSWDRDIKFGRSHEILGKVKCGKHGLYLLAEKIRLESFDETDFPQIPESPLFTGLPVNFG